MSVMFRNALHVKWFIDMEAVPANVWTVVTNSSFLFWLMITLVGLLVCAIFNDRLQQIKWIERIHRTLDLAKPYLTDILRVGLGLGLLFQLVTGTYIAPELHTDHAWMIGLLVVGLAGLLLRRTLWISGLALLFLYGNIIMEYGLFHALDYVFYVGIIYYLLVSETKWRATATPILYLLTGFSLAWVAFEKFTMPELAHEIMVERNIPTFGFSVEDFILISAFIEIGLAWSFIVGILNRFVSLVVTLVFITTTTVFGFTEIVGHTILHTLFVMFLIEGEGAFTTPFHFHRSKFLRCLFVLLNFCILLFGFMYLYYMMGNKI